MSIFEDCGEDGRRHLEIKIRETMLGSALCGICKARVLSDLLASVIIDVAARYETDEALRLLGIVQYRIVAQIQAEAERERAEQ